MALPVQHYTTGDIDAFWYLWAGLYFIEAYVCQIKDDTAVGPFQYASYTSWTLSDGLIQELLLTPCLSEHPVAQTLYLTGIRNARQDHANDRSNELYLLVVPSILDFNHDYRVLISLSIEQNED